MFRVFRSRKMLFIALLGFSSGLPLNLTLTGRALQAWLTVSGVDLTTIGLLGVANLPYSLKCLWAPLVDRYAIPGFGRRKGWILVTQAALILALAAIAFQNPPGGLSIIAMLALALAAMSATQDIVVDAYRTDSLEPSEAAAGAGISVLGYRAAMIASGAAALILAEKTSWRTAYLAMAGLMGIALLLSLQAPEPKTTGSTPESLGSAVWMPFAEYFERLGAGKAVLVLVFVVFFRLGDAMLASMATPFLIRGIGFEPGDVGAIQGGLGLVATIVGTLAGGIVASRIGLPRALWIFGGLQALSNLSYLVLAKAGHHYGVMVATIAVENFCSGLGTSVLVGFLMTLCNPRFSATQYALLTSVMAVGRDLLALPSGYVATHSNWPTFFLISAFAAAPGLALLPWVAPWSASKAGPDAPDSIPGSV